MRTAIAGIFFPSWPIDNHPNLGPPGISQQTIGMPSFEVPKIHRAVIVQEDATIKTEERPIPTVGENEILVKVSAIAINPTDWKREFAPGSDTNSSLHPCS